MKREQNEVSRIKKNLLNKKRRGEKYAIEKISSKVQLEEIDRLGFTKEPWLYEIHTRYFYNIRNLPSLLKNIHYSKRNGKRVIKRRLKKQERVLLDEYDVYYKPIKYRIDLTSSR